MSGYEESQLTQLLEEVQATRKELSELRTSLLGTLDGSPGLVSRVATLEATINGRKWIEKTAAGAAIVIVVGLVFTTIGWLVVQVRPSGGTINVNTSQRSP